ncbi:MAG: hypothetical protein ACI8RZ_002729 [Myxococcota bacterium]|jgi:hypothetical protein
MRSNAAALIVGINDYTAFDASVGNAPGASSLRGAVEDAMTWLRVCRHFGIPPENIRVLTGPVLSEQQVAAMDAEGVTVGTADHASLQAGFAWMAEQLAGGTAGVIFLGGHCHFGDRLRDVASGMGFCATDATGTVDGDTVVMENTVNLRKLKRQLTESGNDNLTLLADFCHVPKMPRRMMRRRQLWQALGGQWPGIGTRMLAACAPRERSAEALLDGRWQGAFTWAASNALLQWQRVMEDGVVRSTVSYERLAKAVNGMLGGIGFEQECQFAGAPPALPVFHPGLTIHPGETSLQPDAWRGDRQLSGGISDDFRVYHFDLGTTPGNKPAPVPTLGLIIATVSDSPSGSYQEDCEYFRFSQAALAQMAAQGFTMWVADCSWQTAQQLPSLHAVVTWSPGDPNTWASGRLITSEETVTEPLQSGGVFTGATPGNTVGARMDFVQGTGAPPIVTWLHQNPGYVFDSVPGASLNPPAGPAYRNRFSAANRVIFQEDPQCTALGWIAYGSVSVPDATTTEP